MLDSIAAFYHAHEALLYGLFAASLFAFVLTLLAVPWMVVRIPHDYFARREREHLPRGRNHALRLAVFLGKNLLGLLFIVMGVVMLVLPGQGLLTILIGIVLLDFPRKYQFERWLVCKKPILASVNWLRARFHHPPLVF